MASLGQELKRERELRAVSLKEIANLTKISLKYLQALEEDRLDVLPGPFFVKGVLRAFAKAIGADEDYFLNKYHADVLLQTYAVDRERKNAEPFEPVKSRTRLYVILAVTLFVLAILVWVLLVIPNKKGRSVSAKPASEAQRIQTVATPPPRTLEPVLQAQTPPLRLELSFSAETWIQVFADGELRIDGLKRTGEKADCEALKEFLIHTGNAGGFGLTINGKPGKPLGGPGVVLTNVRITLENYGQFLASAEKAKVTSAG